MIKCALTTIIFNSKGEKYIPQESFLSLTMRESEHVTLIHISEKSVVQETNLMWCKINGLTGHVQNVPQEIQTS